MTLTDSRESTDQDVTEDRAPAATEFYIPRSKQRISPASDPVSMVRRLDVDAVLERSVRKVVTE